MEARVIDPRDAVQEVNDPTYRVYFWADDGSGKEEWELSKADLGGFLNALARLVDRNVDLLPASSS